VAAEAPPPDLRLVGVVAGVDNAVAILRRSTGGSSLSLKLGDTVEAWRVQAIGPDRVTLSSGKRETTYRLFSGGPSNPMGPRGNGLPPMGIPLGR
jgi:type II secretory pathway component PulC